MRDDLTPGQLDALRQLGWKSPAERKAGRRKALAREVGIILAVVAGSVLFLKACQWSGPRHHDPAGSDDYACNHRGCE